MQRVTLGTPLGPVRILGTSEAVTAIRVDEHPPKEQPAAKVRDGPVAAAAEQLAEYFAGRRTRFELPLAPDGTAFQHRVWTELGRIPFGCTLSYGEIARRLGKPRAARAVGTANAANPLAIVVPCPRVIAGDGSLGGYSAGPDIKRRLLSLEGAAPYPTRCRSRAIDDRERGPTRAPSCETPRPADRRPGGASLHHC